MVSSDCTATSSKDKMYPVLWMWDIIKFHQVPNTCHLQQILEVSRALYGRRYIYARKLLQTRRMGQISSGNQGHLGTFT